MNLLAGNLLQSRWWPWRWDLRCPQVWLKSLCGMAVLFSCAQVLLFSFGRDQSIFAAVGEGILNGEMPYRERWDFKPPGIFLVYALAQGLFGKTMLGIRLLEVGGMLATAWLMVGLSRRFFADVRPGYLAAAIACWVHAQMEFWHSGQPETFGGFLTIAGIYLSTTLGSTDRRQWVHWLAAGACFGFAFLLKPPLGGGAVVCAAYLVRKQQLSGASLPRASMPLWLLGAGSVLPIALCAGWFLLRGAWPELRWTLFDFTPGYTRLSWGQNGIGALYFAFECTFFKHSALIGLGSLAAFIGAPLSGRDREGIALVGGVLAVHLSGIALQAKYYAYHFDATLPLAAIIAGVGWFKLWRPFARQGGGGVVAFAAVLFLVGRARIPVSDVPEGYWTRSWERTRYWFGLSEQRTREQLDERFHFVADFNLAADRLVAERIRSLTSPNDPIFIWGFEPVIYWLSERPPASRFIYNVPQRAQWQREYAQGVLLAELTTRPPQVIVVQHHDYFAFVTGDERDSKRSLEIFPELERQLQEEYTFVEQIEDFEIYVRQPSHS